MSDSDRIRIVQIDLGINLSEEIKKETATSNETRARIRDVMHKMVQQKTPKQAKANLFDDKFGILFNAMHTGDSVSKENVASIMGIEASKIGPIIMRFKAYLKRTHDANWFLEIKVKSGTRIYRLINLTQ